MLTTIKFLLPLVLFPLTFSLFATDPPFYGIHYADIPFARGLAYDDAGDLLVSTRRESNDVYVVYEEQNETETLVISKVILSAPGWALSHGIAFHKEYLYLSNASTVFRWPYESGSRAVLSPSSAESVIIDIPFAGDPVYSHFTRTLLIDSMDRLYVNVGSETDVDQDSRRAKIMRFFILPGIVQEFYSGEVVADGVRNEVGLNFDSYGVLWGVGNNTQNSPNRPDLGSNFGAGNPAEELNRFDTLGTKYGYPYCLSSYLAEGYETNTQFLDEHFLNDTNYSDEWCRDMENNRPPILALPAHTAPLDIDFYMGDSVCNIGEGSFPCDMINDAVIPFHSTEYRLPSVDQNFGGNLVASFSFNATTREPTGEYTKIIYEENVVLGNCHSTCFRPVNSIFDRNGHLFVSSDYGDSGHCHS